MLFDAPATAAAAQDQEEHQDKEEASGGGADDDGEVRLFLLASGQADLEEKRGHCIRQCQQQRLSKCSAFEVKANLA